MPGCMAAQSPIPIIARLQLCSRASWPPQRWQRSSCCFWRASLLSGSFCLRSLPPFPSLMYADRRWTGLRSLRLNVASPTFFAAIAGLDGLWNALWRSSPARVRQRLPNLVTLEI